MTTYGLPRQTIVGYLKRTNYFKGYNVEGKDIECVVANVYERTFEEGVMTVDKL